MISLQEILGNPIVNRIGLALMHSVWECTAVGVLFAVVMLALRKRRSQVRYNIALAALLIMVIMPAVTFFVVGAGGPEESPADLAVIPVVAEEAISSEHVEIITGDEMPVVNTDLPPAAAEAVPVEVSVVKDKPAEDAAGVAEKIEIAGPYLALGWIVGVLVLSVWHLGGWAQLRRLRRVMVKPVEKHVSAALGRLADSLAVKRAIDIVESALVTVPTVIGAVKPVILLPASALTGLSAEQLEMILAHELAHIKRNDYLMNLIQTAIDILLFYHPAAWYVSHRIRDERENCCDDIAVKVTGDSLKYARALATMEEIKATNRRLAVAATGGSFFDRVARLVGKEDSRKSKPSWQTVLITMLVVTAAVMPLCFAMSAKSTDPKAKLLVEEFFKKDDSGYWSEIKTIEWGKQSQDEYGSISIRYKYEGTNRFSGKIVYDAVFMFDKNGKRIRIDYIRDNKTEEGIKSLVIGGHFNLIGGPALKKAVEWGDFKLHENGNSSIRFKYEAVTHWGEEIKGNQIFTVDKDGKIVSVKDVEGQPDESAEGVATSKLSIRLICTEGKIKEVPSPYGGSYVKRYIDLFKQKGRGSGGDNLKWIPVNGLVPDWALVRDYKGKKYVLLSNGNGFADSGALGESKEGHWDWGLVDVKAVKNDKGTFDIAYELDDKAGKLVEKKMYGYKGSYVAVVFDDRIVSVFEMDKPVKAKGVIRCGFDEKEAKDYAAKLKAGMPAAAEFDRLITQGSNDKVQVFERIKYLVEHNESLVDMPFTMWSRSRSRIDPPLTKAISYGRGPEVVKFLVEKGAKVNSSGKNGQPALHAAVERGDKAIIEVLLANGADINLLNSMGLTPLSMSLVREFAGGDIINKFKYLISRGADINAKGQGGFSPLSTAVMMKSMYTLQLNNAGDDKRKEECEKALGELTKVIELLVSKNAKKDIFAAAGLGDLKSIKAMIKKDPSVVSATGAASFTPLHLAAMSGQMEAAKLLLEKGADADAKSSQGTVTALTARAGDFEMLKLLEKHLSYSDRMNSDKSVIYNAVKEGHVEIVKHVLDNSKFLKVDTASEYGETYLHTAAAHGKLEVVKLLIDRGAKVDARTKDRKTPFHEAALNAGSPAARPGRQYKEIIKLLLKSGADINAADNSGRTPLLGLLGFLEHSSFKSYDVIKLLVDNGADVNAARKDHEDTPLAIAVKKNDFELVEMFLKAGADPFFAVGHRHQKNLPIMIAKNRKVSDKIVKLLEEAMADRLKKTNKVIKATLSKCLKAIVENDNDTLLKNTLDLNEYGNNIWLEFAERLRKQYKGHYDLFDDIEPGYFMGGWADASIKLPEGGSGRCTRFTLMQMPDQSWRLVSYASSVRMRPGDGVRTAIGFNDDFRKKIFDDAKYDHESEKLFDWLKYDPAAISKDVEGGRPVIVKFVADWCTTCPLLDRQIFNKKDVFDLLKQKGVHCYLGNTTTKGRAATDLKQKYKQSGVPLTVIYLPGGEMKSFTGLFIKKRLVDILESLPEISGRSNAKTTKDGGIKDLPKFKTKMANGVEVEIDSEKTPGRRSKETVSSPPVALNIEFAERITIARALYVLGQFYKKNIVPSNKVNTKDQVTVTNLFDVTFEEALQAVIGNNRFVYEGNLVKVYTLEEYAKLYGSDYKTVRNEFKQISGQFRHYVRLIGVEDGFVFEGKRYKGLSELNDPLSKLADKSNTVLEWAFGPGKMPKDKKSMAWLGIVYFISDLEKLVDEHGLGGLCYAGELPVESGRVTFPAGNWRSFAMDKEIELDLKSGPIELKSVKFVKDGKLKGSPYKALINAKVTTWPKTKIEIRLELKSKGADDQNIVLYKTFENSGIIKGIAKTGSQVIEIPFFGDIDDGFIEDVKMVEVRIRQIGTDLDKSKAAEIIGRWVRAFDVLDFDVIKELVGPGNEKSFEELKRMAMVENRKDSSKPEIKKDPVILNITKTSGGKYRVLTLIQTKDYAFNRVHYLVAGDDGFKVVFDLAAHLKAIRDTRTMSAEDIGKRKITEKADRWKNAEGKELEGLVKKAIQSLRDGILAADYAQKHKINAVPFDSKDIADRLKAKIEKLEQMTPQQVREAALKEYEDLLGKYDGNAKSGKASDASDSSKKAVVGHSNDDKSLGFLSGIREFKDLRLGMTEKELRSHIDAYSLAANINAVDGYSIYVISNEQGEIVFVTVRNGKCAGIQLKWKGSGTAAKLNEGKIKNTNPLPTHSKPVSKVKDRIAIYQVIGHENALPFKSKGQAKRRRIIFGDRKSDKGASRFDAMKPENYPLDGLIVADKPFIAESDIVSYDWQKHVIQVKPEVFSRIPKTTSVWGDPFVVVAGGKPQYLGAFWAAGSSYSACIPTISSMRWDGKLPESAPAYLPKNSIRIHAAMWAREGKETLSDVRNNINVLKALKEAGIITGSKSGKTIDDGEKTVHEALMPENSKADLPEKITFSVVDKSGKPVSGAAIGNHFYPLGKDAGQKPRLIWGLQANNITDDQGKVTVSFTDLSYKVLSEDMKIDLCVYDESRKLGYWQKLSRSDLASEMTLELSSVCRVRGNFICKGCDRKNYRYLDANVELGRDGKRIFGNNARRDDFDLLLFAGKYYIEADGMVYNDEVSMETGKKRIEFEVKAGQKELKLEDIDLPKGKIAGLIGKPAPKLGTVKSWHNGQAVKLSDLKGKAVMLYFGGDSASVGILNMFADMHKKFAAHGLEIIAVYNADDMASLQETWKESYKPIAEFMKRIDEAQKNSDARLKAAGLWVTKRPALIKYHGLKEVPFRVVIDSGDAGVYDDGSLVRQGSTYQAYGIERKTSVVLIGKDGKVAGNLNLSEAEEMIARMLGIEIEKKPRKSGPENEIPQWPEPDIYTMSGTESRKLAAING